LTGFREARLADAAALGELHVASWRETYAGVLPATLLEDLSVEGRTAMWTAVLRAPARFDRTGVFVAEGASGIVGFGACGGQRDPTLAKQGFIGEIGAIYVLKSHQRAGLGAALMDAMALRLMEQEREAAALWVLRENLIACRFYEQMGGAVVAERVEAEAGAELHEVAYGWRDLALLRARIAARG
jgi:ribosomal protein S18 acetylase RimI-like enzyme